MTLHVDACFPLRGNVYLKYKCYILPRKVTKYAALPPVFAGARKINEKTHDE